MDDSEKSSTTFLVNNGTINAATVEIMLSVSAMAIADREGLVSRIRRQKGRQPRSGLLPPAEE
ncbi:hypothetical protein D3C84_915810 [compost metagenome]